MATDNDKSRLKKSRIHVGKLDDIHKRNPSTNSPNDCPSPLHPVSNESFTRNKSASDNSQDIASGVQVGMTRSQIEDDKEESKTSDGIQNFEHIQSGFNRQAGCTQYLRRQAIANDAAFNSETPPFKS